MTSALSSDEPFAESSAWRNPPKGPSDRDLTSSQLEKFIRIVLGLGNDDEPSSEISSSNKLPTHQKNHPKLSTATPS